MDAVVDSACSSIQAALESLTTNQSSSVEQDKLPTKQELAMCADAVQFNVSKIALLWSQTQKPQAADAQGALQGLQQHILGYLAWLQVVQTIAGPTLQRQLKISASTLTSTCVAFLQALKPCEVEQPLLLQLAGGVVEQCDAIKKTPLDNRTAIGRSITNIAASVKDTIREMEDMLKTPSNTDEEGDAQSAGSDVLDFEACLNEQELCVAASCKQLIESCMGFQQTIIRTLLRADPPSRQTSLDAWESIHFHMKSMSVCLEDLVAALYPPQASSELLGAADGVVNCFEIIVDELPVSNGTAADLAGMMHAIEEAHMVFKANLLTVQDIHEE